MMRNLNRFASENDGFKMRALGTLLVFTAAALVYAPAVLIYPFFDDWAYITNLELHGLNIFHAFVVLRLWERIVNVIGFELWDTAFSSFTIVVGIVMLLTTARLVASIAKQVAPGLSWAPLTASALFLFHPVNASSVIQIDAISQMMAVALTLLTVRYSVFSSPLVTSRSIATAFGLALAALLAKETVVGSLLWLPIAAYVHSRWVDHRENRYSARKAVTLMGVVVLAVVTFYTVKFLSGAPVVTATEGRYSIHWAPLLILTNSAQLAGSALFFGDTASALIFGFSKKLVIGILASLGLALAAIRAMLPMLWAPARDSAQSAVAPAFWIWLSFAPPALFPVMLMGAVSELYAAGVAPFVALVYGIGIAHFMQGGAAHARAEQHSSRRFMAALMFLIAVSAWGIFSITDKIRLNAQVSERSWAFVHAVKPALHHCTGPLSNLTVKGNLVDTTSGGKQYSVYSLSNEHILRTVLRSVTQPDRLRWLPRFAATRTPDINVWCASLSNPQAPATCTLHCEAYARSQSKSQSCKILREKCDGAASLASGATPGQ